MAGWKKQQFFNFSSEYPPRRNPVVKDNEMKVNNNNNNNKLTVNLNLIKSPQWNSPIYEFDRFVMWCLFLFAFGILFQN